MVLSNPSDQTFSNMIDPSLVSDIQSQKAKTFNLNYHKKIGFPSSSLGNSFHKVFGCVLVHRSGLGACLEASPDKNQSGKMSSNSDLKKKTDRSDPPQLIRVQE